MADRWAEQGGALPGLNGEQGDLQLKAQEFLHDHPVASAAGTGQRRLPGGVDAGGVPHQALALARGAHHGFDHHGPAQGLGGGGQLFGAVGIGVAGRAQAQLPGRQIADAVAIHGYRRGSRRGDDALAFRLQFGQGIHRQGFDFGDQQIRLVAPHHRLEGIGVGHGHHLGQVGHLHRRGARVAIHGDHPAAQALGGDGHLLAQFAAAQQHQGLR